MMVDVERNVGVSLIRTEQKKRLQMVGAWKMWGKVKMGVSFSVKKKN